MVIMATKSDWAARIKAAWQKSVDGIFETGRLLIAAKAKLPHGQFEAMVRNELPFGERTAQCLMAIAKDARLRRAHHGSLLPPSWRTLDELTRLSDEQFDAAVANGTINPEMTRGDVVTRPRHAPEVGKAATIRYLIEESVVEPQTMNFPIKHTTQEIPLHYMLGETRPLLESPSIDAANRLIDALCNISPDVCRKAAELLANKRAADLDAVRQTIAELNSLLTKKNRRRGA
jgi:hypothetical protein